MFALADKVFDKLLVDALAALALLGASWAILWYTPLSGWIDRNSNKKHGRIVSSALSAVGLKHMIQKNPEKVLTEADIVAIVEGALAEELLIEGSASE